MNVKLYNFCLFYFLPDAIKSKQLAKPFLPSLNHKHEKNNKQNVRLLVLPK